MTKSDASLLIPFLNLERRSFCLGVGGEGVGAMTGVGVEIENTSLFSESANPAWLVLKSSTSFLVTTVQLSMGMPMSW